MIMIIVLPIALILSFFGCVSYRPFMTAVALAVDEWTGAMDCGCNRSCSICLSDPFLSFLSPTPSPHPHGNNAKCQLSEKKKRKEMQPASFSSASFMLYFDSYLNGNRCFPLLCTVAAAMQCCIHHTQLEWQWMSGGGSIYYNLGLLAGRHYCTLDRISSKRERSQRTQSRPIFFSLSQKCDMNDGFSQHC